MAREPKLGLQLRVYDESSDEDEAPPVAVGEPIVFAQPAPDAVVEEAPPSTSDGRVRCSTSSRAWRCKHMFVPGLTPQGNLQKLCERCRATKNRSNHSVAGKAARNRFMKSDKGKVVMKQRNQSEKGKAGKRRYLDSELGKATKKRLDKEFSNSEKGKANIKRKNAKISHQILTRVGRICRENGIESVTALKATGCKSNEELRAHFESTFEPWMNWTNQGRKKAGGNSGTWQIGHRLACAFYDDGNPADIKRCWHKANLFAQDADENIALSVKMPDEVVLERLRTLDLLPCAWHGIVPPAEQRAKMERTTSLRVDYR
tara:strand:- start:332 stop:1282 length:951 start_codon:yes stop_codon:yes gene_type:complete